MKYNRSIDSQQSSNNSSSLNNNMSSSAQDGAGGNGDFGNQAKSLRAMLNQENKIATIDTMKQSNQPSLNSVRNRTDLSNSTEDKS